jgi:hypothetical protein
MVPRQTRAESAAAGGRRAALVVTLLIGLGLVGAPFAFGMFTRAPEGANMIVQFKPYMTAPRLEGYERDIAQINAGVRQTDTSVASYLDQASPHAGSFDSRFADFAQFDRQWPQIDTTMTTLMTSVRGNLGNYLAVAALPSFTLFPWFFLVPGALLALFSGIALLRPRSWLRLRWVLAVLGVGLIAAPAVFQMFTRAPDGGRMMSAFRTIETTQNVQTIQGYFGSMAVGQGAIRLEIVPALESNGLTPTEIGSRFPAVETLDANWVHILNGMTPMIGAMSNNVANYDAVASLPPFPLFPWFFVIPGVIALGAAVLVWTPPGRTNRATRVSRREAPVPASALPLNSPASSPLPEGVST